MKKLKTRGRGLRRQEWYSICSAHQEYKEDCERCNCGTWSNVWRVHFSNLVYKIAPGFWIWWVNRRRDKNEIPWKNIEE